MGIEKTQIIYIYALMYCDNIRYIGKSDNQNKTIGGEDKNYPESLINN